MPIMLILRHAVQMSKTSAQRGVTQEYLLFLECIQNSELVPSFSESTPNEWTVATQSAVMLGRSGSKPSRLGCAGGSNPGPVGNCPSPRNSVGIRRRSDPRS